MRPSRVYVTATLILLAGIGVAQFFRRDAGPTGVPVSPQDDILVRRQIPGALIADERSLTPRSNPTTGQPAGGKEPLASLSPFDSQDPQPPPIARLYPSELPAEARPTAALSHRIVDGDTLAALSQRYLGDSGRAAEIYSQNRDVLSDPELLPIGALLKIPNR